MSTHVSISNCNPWVNDSILIPQKLNLFNLYVITKVAQEGFNFVGGKRTVSKLMAKKWSVQIFGLKPSNYFFFNIS